MTSRRRGGCPRATRCDAPVGIRFPIPAQVHHARLHDRRDRRDRAAIGAAPDRGRASGHRRLTFCSQPRDPHAARRDTRRSVPVRRREASLAIAHAAHAEGVTRMIQESFGLIYPDRGATWIDESMAVSPVGHTESVLDAETVGKRVHGRWRHRRHPAIRGPVWSRRNAPRGDSRPPPGLVAATGGSWRLLLVARAGRCRHCRGGCACCLVRHVQHRRRRASAARRLGGVVGLSVRLSTTEVDSIVDGHVWRAGHAVDVALGADLESEVPRGNELATQIPEDTRGVERCAEVMPGHRLQQRIERSLLGPTRAIRASGVRG